MSWRDRPYSDGGFEGGGGWGGGSRFSDNPLSWAPSIGTVFGIRVQLHIIFLIFIAIELLRGASEGQLWLAFRYELMLFGLVFLHELGHCFGARHVGGSADRILMWPLGGLAYVAPPHRPGANLFTAAAGPAVNLAFCILVAVVMIAAAGSLNVIPWNPFNAYPSAESWILMSRSDTYFWLYQFFYVNYILLLFNVCLPMYPLDGGRIFQSIAWYRMGYGRSMKLATTAGMVGAVVLGCVGLFTRNFMLIGIAIFGYLTCMQQRKMQATYGDQEFEFATAYAKPEPSPRRSRRREGAWARKQQKLAEEQAEVDRILAKVHERGIQSLSRKEKRILSRATRKQQDRDREAGRVDRL